MTTLLSSLLDKFGDSTLGRPVVHGMRCIRLLHKKAECTRCLDVCPVDAIRIGRPGTSVFIDDNCLHCERCVAVCPVDGFSRFSGNEESWLSELAACTGSDMLTLGCFNSSWQTKSRIVCLGSLHPSAILYILTSGISTFRLSFGDCSICELGNRKGELSKIIDSLQELLHRYDLPCLQVDNTAESITCSVPFKNRRKVKNSSTRRQFFHHFTTLLQKSMKPEKMPPPSFDYSQAKHLIYRKALDRWKNEAGRQDTNFPVLHRDTLYVNKLICKGCGLCVKLCCHDALSMGKEETPPGLEEHLCSQCGLCVSVCQVGARSFSNAADGR